MQHQAIITQGLTVDDLIAHVRAVVRDEVQALPQPKPERPYLMLHEVAELTGISKSVLYQLTSKKQIPHIKKGGKLLFRRTEVDEWLSESQQPVTE